MIPMEQYILEKIKEILEKQKDIDYVDMYMQSDGSMIVRYKYNGEWYSINIKNNRDMEMK